MNNIQERAGVAKATLEGVNEYLEYCEELHNAYDRKHQEIIEATDRLDKIL